MAVTGYLSEFSLGEIFQFLGQGHKTGCLTIKSSQADTYGGHYVWFKGGAVVAAANALDNEGLIRLITSRGWWQEGATNRLMASCATHEPLGICLKSQAALQSEQLQHLFSQQVLRQICELFTIPEGWFRFETAATLPLREMTGLSAPSVEVILAGLRALKDWRALYDKLPEPSSKLVNVAGATVPYRLNQLESRVWEYTNGKMQIVDVAKHLSLSLLDVQKIAFRLIVAGVIEELPTIEGIQEVDTSQAVTTPAVSQSFMQNLMAFLTQKANS